MPDRILGYLYLSLAMVTVGSTVIASKLIASGLPPFAATALRFAIALPLFAMLMQTTGTRLPRLSLRHFTLLALQAGAGSVGYTTLLISGLRYTAAADAGVVIGTLPVVSAAVAIVVLGERPQRGLIAAILLAAAGVAAITFVPDDRAGHSLLGNGLIFAAVICEGIFILLNKRLPVAIPPLAQSALMTGLGLAVALVPAIFETPWRYEIGASALLAVAYYALVPTVCGFVFWYQGAARVSGAEASLFTAVAPVSAVLLAAAFLGEPVSGNQMAGIGCVLVAVIGSGLSQAGVLRFGHSRAYVFGEVRERTHAFQPCGRDLAGFSRTCRGSAVDRRHHARRRRERPRRGVFGSSAGEARLRYGERAAGDPGLAPRLREDGLEADAISLRFRGPPPALSQGRLPARHPSADRSVQCRIARVRRADRRV
jgi:drug/metabolite transporter (DMT)-like permease